MESLDFLSQSPNMFIFQKKANKTICGGILFLIYLIIAALFTLVYCLDYKLNDKYIYESLIFQNSTMLSIEERQKILEDERINPYLNFTVNIKYENFTVFDYRNPIDPVPIKMDKAYVDGRYIYTFKERLEYSNIMIAYICGENKTCNTFDENTDLGNIQIIFPEYTINHTNNPPVDEHSSISYFSKIFPFSESIRFQDIKFEWENIKYNDQNSLFDTLTRKKTEYIFGYIKNIENKIEKFGINNISINRYIKGYGYCLFLINMRFFNEHKTYLYNKRTLISFIDVLAKLFSLLMTINSVFKVVYSFYSKNYDNYEIIEKILNPPKELIVKKEDTTELKDITSIKPE